MLWQFRDSAGWTYDLRDVFFVGAIFFAFFGTAEFHRLTDNSVVILREDKVNFLGAEFDAIAQSIRMGSGFSSPFRVNTGATSWMAPLLPFLLAFIYWATGDDRQMVVTIVYTIQMLIVFAGGTQVAAVARSYGAVKTGFTCIIIGFSSHFYYLFQVTHDTWISMLFVNYFIVACTHYSPFFLTTKRCVAWGLGGGLAGLANPVLLAGWLSLSFLQMWNSKLLAVREFPIRLIYGRLLISLATFIAVLTPWFARNYFVFNQFIPVKSNLAFELWQSQVVDVDGVIDGQSLDRHPWVRANEERRLYVSLGERRYLDTKACEFLNSMQSAPVSYLQKVFNRTIAAFFCRHILQGPRANVSFMGGILLVIPVSSLILSLMICGGRLEAFAVISIILFVAALAPYAIISYYERYRAPLVLCEMFVILGSVIAIRKKSCRFCSEADCD